MTARHAPKHATKGGKITGVDCIPPALISSLTTLGLSNDETRVFATLVLFDHAEAKEVVEYLSLSKPSVYKALQSLAGRGLALQQKSKPVRYRAISPEMAVSILLEEHENASVVALAGLKKLEEQNVRTDLEDPLWTIYGDTNIEHKILELFRNARHHISCIVGDRYLPLLDHVPVRDIPFDLNILSSTPGLKERISEKFHGKETTIHITPVEWLTTPPPDVSMPELKEVWKYLKFDNVLELNIDDEELLMSAAFFSRGVSVLNTRNKGAIIQMKMLSQLFWKRFVEE